MDYKEELRKKLPELKKIDGFPISTDDDIIEISNPPFYTACPNPFVKDFIKENGNSYNPETDTYNKEPFDGDISESKSDHLYNLHTYHTKVPPAAITKKILHYTEPGDLVFDAFSGTGMTGLAAMLCDNLSYFDKARKSLPNEVLKKGKRKVVLSELSPIASLISYNYCKGTDSQRFLKEATRVLREVQEETDWMFKCKHTNGEFGVINYTVYSDVFICPYCESDIVFWDEGVDKKAGRNKKELICPSCSGDVTNQNLKRKQESSSNNGGEIAVLKPVQISYNYAGKKFTKDIDEYDLEVLEKISKVEIPYWYPTNEIPDGYNTRQPKNSHGITTVDQFYSKRNLYATSALFDKIIKSDSSIKHSLLFWLMSVMLGQTKMNRYFEASFSQVNRYLKGTLYVGKKISEVNFIYSLKGKMKKISKYLTHDNEGDFIVSTGSATNLLLPDNSIDYIFTDPPFGGNIMYSELNFIWESWLKVLTNNQTEAIMNDYQQKGISDYENLMFQSFKEYYRVLKPKRWITVEFHNSKSEIWNAIQRSLTKSGFVIASVSILDKKQETFKQMVSPGSVKSDLAITAFKPSVNLENRLITDLGKDVEHIFIEEFLENIPVKPIIERSEKMLYSKMLAYYLQNSYEIHYDAKSFYSLLSRNFIEEDGYWFTSSQINSYLEYKKLERIESLHEFKKGSLHIFISDEKSSILWLFDYLLTPKPFNEVSIAFNQKAAISGDKIPDLRVLLEENFVFEGGVYRRPKSEEEHNQITEKRQKHLWKEFETILIQAQTERKKIKEVRKEALAYGFERCYKEKRFKDILTIASKLHPSILENNGELADFVEAAEIQTEGLA